MSLLLDALQRASKEKEKLAESRGAPAAPPAGKATNEPAAERSPFPSLSIESDGGDSNAAPTVELMMEPIVTEVPAIPDAPRIHDPVPASAAPLAYAEPQVAAMPAQEIQLSVAEVPSESQSGLSSPAVAEITASDAVERALAPFGALAAKLPSDPNVLEAAIEKAQPAFQRADAGPAEPPGLVPALGEEPDPVEPEVVAASAQVPLPVAETVVEAASGDTEGEPVAARIEAQPAPTPMPGDGASMRPATTAGRPFNPEVPPPAEEKP